MPTGELIAIDVLWSAATGLAFADPILGRAMQVRYFLRALRAGDVRRIARRSRRARSRSRRSPATRTRSG